MVYVEMNVFVDVVCFGRLVKGFIIFVMIYLCYNCVKYLVVLGIECIVFIEFYLKSKIESLFQDIIVFDMFDIVIVLIEYFYGVFLWCYCDIFEKGS